MAGLYDERVLGAQQRAEFARKLRESSNQPAGQMVSGWYVPNTGNAVMGALGNILGAYQERQANDELKSIQKDKGRDYIRLLNQMGMSAPESMLKEYGTPEEKPGFIDRTVAFLKGEEAPSKPAVPFQQNIAQNVSPEQKNNALLELSGVNPEMASNIIGLEKIKAEQAKEARKEFNENVPVGWTKNQKGELVSMPIAGGGDYSQYSMDKALAGQRFLSPQELQSMQIQQANLGLAQRKENREMIKKENK